VTTTAGEPDAAPEAWEAPVRDGLAAGEGGEALIVDVDGFEGPLDLLLALARTQKVDLARISILALVEQYLAFIGEARRMRLELAADYLVMAAWLAYLKSRLLLPPPPADEGPSGEELADALAFRLRRLEAMRAAAARLAGRARLGRDVFARGAPEALAATTRPLWQASLYDLLAAYAAQRQRQAVTTIRVSRRAVWSLVDARAILERLVGHVAAWTELDVLMARYLADPAERTTVRASTFTASLELAKEGLVELSQTAAFAPIYLRARPGGGEGRDG
jgi:segregation and condensation protein A